MTRREHIIAAALAGTPRTRIARDTGVKVGTVYRTLWLARLDGHPVPRLRPGPRNPRSNAPPPQDIRMIIDPATAATLAAEARARSMTPSHLAHRLITVICDDALFDAVLDE